MTACPDLEALAAYLDGTVDQPTREAIEAHLADCDACYDLVVEMAHAVDPVRSAGHSAVAGISARPYWYGAIGLLAAAAVLFLVVRLAMPGRQRAAPLSDAAFAPLVAAVGPERLIEPRLTGGFQFGPLRSKNRGTSQTANLALTVALADVAQAARSAPGPATRRALGIAQLLDGQQDNAIRTLDEVCRGQGADASCEADLGAAYLTRASATRSATDFDAAAAHTRRALELRPDLREAAFNDALILEQKGLRREAADAWSRYLRIDPDSPWAGEAERHRARLGT